MDIPITEMATVTQEDSYSPSKQGRRPSTRQIEQRNKRVSPPYLEHTDPPQETATHQSNPSTDRRFTPPNKHYEHTTTLAPLRPPHSMRRNHHSTSSALNQLRHEVSSKLGHTNNTSGSVMHAWHSNSTSRNSSRNPSRQGSRQASRDDMRRAISFNMGSMHSRAASFDSADSLALDPDPDELDFYSAESNTLPRASTTKKKRLFSLGDSSDSITDSSHLPSITEREHHSSWSKKRASSNPTQLEKTKNDHLPARTLDFRTNLGVEEVVTEILRAAHSLKMREAVSGQSGAYVTCTWNGVKFQVCVSVSREHSTCKLTFQWISGGDAHSYEEKCEQLSKKLKL